MGFEIFGTEHVGGDIKGVNFGGVQDKMTARMPNEGNKCAYPKCPMSAIGEGQPARFAHNNPMLWCHKACADRWEAEEPGLKIEPEPVPDKPRCGAPHPELHEYRCANDEGHGHYHNSGAGHSWYMEPAQVATLKAAVAAKYGPVTQDEVDQAVEEMGVPSSNDPSPNDIVAEEMQADTELSGTALDDTHVAKPWVDPTNHLVREASADVQAATPKERPGVGLTSTNSPPDGPAPTRAQSYLERIQASADTHIAERIAAKNASTKSTDPVVVMVLEIVNIFRKYGTLTNPELINDLIAWKRS